MSRQIKQPIKGLQGMKKYLIIPAAAAGILIFLTIIAAVKLNPSEEKLDADLKAYSAASTGEKEITVNPHPYYNVKISADGQTYSVRSTGTVADALKTAGISVNSEDLINVAPCEPLNSSTSIVVNRVEYVEEVRVATIDYATKYKEDDNYVIGYKEVVVDGEEGELETVVRHTYVDGKLTDSDIISTEVTEEPVDKVILMGTSEVNPIEEMSISTLKVPDYLTLDENGIPTSYSEVYTGKATAYSARPTAKTASGRTVKVGYVAVNPDLIPYGSEMYIVSTDGKTVYGYAIAADTGTALMDGTVLVDVFMESYDASCDWGAKQVNVYVL